MDALTIQAATIQHVTHRYDDTKALQEISVGIPAGKITGVIGPDGVGKSTLLGLIAGARVLQQGQLQVLGGDITNPKFRRRILPKIAYMPQGLGKNLYADLSVAENIDFIARLFGHSRQERQQRIDRLLTATGLADFKTRPAGKLSGGMKQKLSLCAALIHDPELLILDEPTTGIDPLSRRQFWQLLEQIRHENPAMTVLIATAYMDEAAQFDWLIAMNAGEILRTGTPADLQHTHQATTLEDAFIALLPEDIRKKHTPVQIPPLTQHHNGPVIEAKNLTRNFNSFTAVDDVSFEIQRGEIFGFLGSNGCGKTTTMKMLTGLLPSSSGTATIFGKPVDSISGAAKRRVGYMSQSFSLYNELTVQQNLALHGRLFHVPANTLQGRVAHLLQQFDLESVADQLPSSLPLGLRQRLSLAVAMVHEPDILILDEPTSGVDPIARDQFWQWLIDLSRNQGVTIFISTHFMNEGERCDRLSFMHAGKVLARGTPASLMAASQTTTLEDACIHYLEQATPKLNNHSTAIKTAASPAKMMSFGFLQRVLACSFRETKELLRDPIRLGFSLFGTVLMMIAFGYGISTDVEGMTYAALDHDQTPESRQYLESLSGSTYFDEQPPLLSERDIQQRLSSNDITLAVQVPPGFGKDLIQGRQPEVGAMIDGAMPFRAETIHGYLEGVHGHYLHYLQPLEPPFTIESRFRYNQDFKSANAMVPSNIAIMLVFIPAMMAAIAVVREKELGSIINLYVTPLSKLEFLLGKQLPYVVVSMVNFALMVLLAVLLFHVPIKGDVVTLTLGALLYVLATTAFGLVMSSFAKTQIAALFLTAIASVLPAIQFSGLLQPISSLEGFGAFIGSIYPTSHFMTVSVGVFTKALDFQDLIPSLLALAVAWPILFNAGVRLLKDQAR